MHSSYALNSPDFSVERDGVAAPLSARRLPTASPRLAPPRPGVPMCEVSLRYADFDANGHLNNPAYLEALQTALSRRGGPVAPRGLEVQFLREVPPEAPAIAVALDGDAEVLRVGWGSGGELRAQGEVRF